MATELHEPGPLVIGAAGARPFPGHSPESTLTFVPPRLAMVAGTPSPWSRRPWNH